MFHRILLTVTILLLVLLGKAHGQTADEIVNKYVTATGGADKWNSVQTFAVTSRSQAFSFDLYWKKPNRVRIEVAVEAPDPGIDIRSFDGTTGWRLSPLEGSTKPRLLSAAEILDLRETGDAFRELIDYKTKGHKVELAGKDSVDGSPVYKLKLTKPSGEVIYIFIDEKTSLEVRRVRNVHSPEGGDRTLVTPVSDYRLVNGLLLPHRVGPATREYHVNIAMDDNGFRMPGTEEQTGSESAEDSAEESALTKIAQNPQRRAELLRDNPEGDTNKDGALSSEEAPAVLKAKSAAGKLLHLKGFARQTSQTF